MLSTFLSRWELSILLSGDDGFFSLLLLLLLLFLFLTEFEGSTEFRSLLGQVV